MGIFTKNRGDFGSTATPSFGFEPPTPHTPEVRAALAGYGLTVDQFEASAAANETLGHVIELADAVEAVGAFVTGSLIVPEGQRQELLIKALLTMVVAGTAAQKVIDGIQAELDV